MPSHAISRNKVGMNIYWENSWTSETIISLHIFHFIAIYQN